MCPYSVDLVSSALLLTSAAGCCTFLLYVVNKREFETLKCTYHFYSQAFSGVGTGRKCVA